MGNPKASTLARASRRRRRRAVSARRAPLPRLVVRASAADAANQPDIRRRWFRWVEWTWSS